MTTHSTPLDVDTHWHIFEISTFGPGEPITLTRPGAEALYSTPDDGFTTEAGALEAIADYGWPAGGEPGYFVVLPVHTPRRPRDEVE